MNEFYKQRKRITFVFGTNKVPPVNPRTLKTYLAYLRGKITLPCQLTGGEDFYWEEFYVFGHGDPNEYEKLKETNPSYTDIFELIDFEDTVHERYGVLVKVKRIKGKNKKHFTIALDQLICTNKYSETYQSIIDYASWFVNFM